MTQVFAYMDNNPVRARMVDVATLYPWSTAGFTGGARTRADYWIPTGNARQESARSGAAVPERRPVMRTWKSARMPAGLSVMSILSRAWASALDGDGHAGAPRRKGTREQAPPGCQETRSRTEKIAQIWLSLCLSVPPVPPCASCFPTGFSLRARISRCAEDRLKAAS